MRIWIWLKAFALFALLVATPYIGQALRRYSRVAGDLSLGDFPWSNVLIWGAIVIAVLAAIIGSIFGFKQSYPVWRGLTIEDISAYLTLAERELNFLIRSGFPPSPKGRKDTAQERADWVQTTILNELSSVPDELVRLNQKDLEGVGANSGKARITAFLLRELYAGNIKNAQSKVYAETKTGGKLPFIAAGLRELLELDKFDTDKGFQTDAGVPWSFLLLAVQLGGHPSHIKMVKGTGEVLRNNEVIRELTQQN